MPHYVISEEAFEATITQLKSDEGFREFMYKCSANKTTIGYGLNLEAGITEEEAHIILRHRLRRISSSLDYNWYRNLNDVRKGVILNMVYQMGLRGVLKFRKMIDAMACGDFNRAAVEMEDSRWFKQTPNRAQRLIDTMRAGK